jgi:signal transduction histidine kinase
MNWFQREEREESLRRTYQPLRWLRPALFAFGIVVIGAFSIFSYMLLQTFREDAERVAQLYAERILPRALKGARGTELGILFDLVQDMPVSIIITDEWGTPYHWKGISVPDTARSMEQLAQVRKIAHDMDQVSPSRTVIMPVSGGGELRWNIHVAETQFLRLVAWIPTAAAAAALIFALVATWGFLQIKSSEQQLLWVGMAKETAHQLGTPLSSLSGWLELLSVDAEETGAVRRRSDDIVPEMHSDVERLKRIANRFDQIGSEPELKPQMVTPVISDTLDYFRTRLPTLGRDVHMERDLRADEEIPLNPELLGWAFENVFKNALDAVSRSTDKPTISVRTWRGGGYLHVEFADTGKGMSTRDLRRIFRPGYTTKKRGWGLGLTFVKRIVEDYHGGRISAHSPGRGKGMTIDMALPAKRV